MLLVFGATVVAGFAFFAADSKGAAGNPRLEMIPFSLVNSGRETEGAIGLPWSEEWRSEQTQDWVFSVFFDTWGIHVADIRGAANHTDTFANANPIRGSEPTSFLLALGATESYEVRGLIETEIDGHPAVSTSVTKSVNADHHLDVGGEGGIHFDLPNQVVIAQIEGRLFLNPSLGGERSDLGREPAAHRSGTRLRQARKLEQVTRPLDPASSSEVSVPKQAGGG